MPENPDANNFHIIEEEFGKFLKQYISDQAYEFTTLRDQFDQSTKTLFLGVKETESKHDRASPTIRAFARTLLELGEAIDNQNRQQNA
jgi:hypothetical protein